jgi:tetratricopeptide (TPR) repeat protein
MKTMKRIVVLAAGCLAFFSCATRPDVYKDIDNHIGINAYDQAVGTIAADQESKKPIYPKKNLIMYYLDKGVVEYYAGKYSESTADLEEAERLIAEAYTKSVSAAIGSFIINDNTKDYPGEDYEDLYTNVFSALSYYHQDDIEGAGVEIRQMTEKLVKLSDKYADDSSKAQESLGENRNMVLPSGKPVQISDSALGRYLSALIYRSVGDTDNARIDIEAIGTAYAKAPNVYKNSPPAWINDELTVPPGQARLNILAFAGLSPVKEEEIVVVPSIFIYATYNARYLNSLKSRGFAFTLDGNDFHGLLLHLPRLVPRPGTIDRIEVDIDETRFNLNLLEDMGAVMSETFNARLSSTRIKTFVRTAAKGAVVEAAALASLDDGRPAIVELIANLFIKGGAMAAMVGFDKTEAADTRSARYFPDKAYAGGITLNPGTYNVKVNYYSGNTLVHSVEKPGVQVAGGKLNLVDTVYLK